jgi:hypothetical protein
MPKKFELEGIQYCVDRLHVKFFTDSMPITLPNHYKFFSAVKLVIDETEQVRKVLNEN